MVILAACAVAVIILVIVLSGCFQTHAEDPNWNKTHTTVTSTEEATQLFGSDLLFDKLVLKSGSSKPYTEYILEHTDENSSETRESLLDRRKWENLCAQINYGGGQFDVDQDNVSLRIFFQENDPLLTGKRAYRNGEYESIPTEEKMRQGSTAAVKNHYFGYEDILEGSPAVKTMNGTTVTYREYTEKRAFEYSFCAKFKHHGYTYFFESYSHKNRNLSWDTLKQMLNT